MFFLLLVAGTFLSSVLACLGLLLLGGGRYV